MLATHAWQSRPLVRTTFLRMCVRVCMYLMHKNYILQDISVKIDIKINEAAQRSAENVDSACCGRATTLKGRRQCCKTTWLRVL